MRAIVTGGAGFIGSHIVDSLVADGINTVSIDDYSAGKRSNLDHLDGNPYFTEVNCDVCSPDMAFWIEDADVIFHNAASKKNICLKDPHRDLEVNADGTLNLLELSRKFGVKKFVHASTGSVYGEPIEFPQTENHPLNPNSYYGVSKLAGERYVSMYSQMGWLDTTILRYFHVYGPRQDGGEFGGVVAIFIKNAEENKPLIIYGDGTQQRSFTYVDDVVRANILACKKPEAKGRIYNCASGAKITINELALIVKQITGSESKIIHRDWLVGDIRQFDVNNSKIKSLGVKFETDFKEGLKKTIEYEQPVQNKRI